MKRFKYIIIGSLLLTACAQTPKNTDSVQSIQPERPAALHESRIEVTPVLPNVELSNDLIYELLLTEIADQRGQKALAAEVSAELARKTRDPRLARRAAQIAAEAGEMDKAVAAFRRWQELEPASAIPARMLSSLLLRGGKFDEAQLELIKVLKAEEANIGYVFLHIFQPIAASPDKAAALKLMGNLAQLYPRVAEARWSVAQLAQLAGDHERALNEAEQARNLRPEWDMAVSLEAQLLQKNKPQQGLEMLRHYLSQYPDAREVRLQYARALLEQKQYKQSRDEFRCLAKDSQGGHDLTLAIALISLQMNDFQEAEEQLKRMLGSGAKDEITAQYYLGQLSEAKKNENEAIIYYRGVKEGEYQLAAQTRVAYLLSKSGKLGEARQYLHELQATDNQQRVQLLLVEAQLLREANQLPEAFQVLQQGLVKLPNHPDLLYEAAMLADKIGKPDLFEQLMRKLIQVKPDHAHAYNALGYSLLERNVRVPEAVKLVERALQLAPDDFAIMDSVGWGYYRSGKLDESVEILRRAFAGNPDPEIASHLGEVLWVRGDKEEAKKIWQDSLTANPANALLQAVMKRFMP